MSFTYFSKTSGISSPNFLFPLYFVKNIVYNVVCIFVSEYEKEYGKHLQVRNIRSVCQGKINHVNNLKFEYITQEEFNNTKLATPELVFGEFFKLRETA